jgi:phosphopantothenoylcysteine synthetase/decarboxylase
MKTSTLARNGVSTEMVDLIGRLVELIPWPARRCAMGDVTVLLLDGKQRVAENVFGWNRRAVEVGINEFRTGIACVNDIATRVKPKTEDKYPQLLAEIQAIMEPHSESESSLRTTLLYTNITAKTVYEALVQKGWTAQSLPSVRTISNLLNRQDYRLRTVAKTRVQKKQPRPTQSLKTSGG